MSSILDAMRKSGAQSHDGDDARDLLERGPRYDPGLAAWERRKLRKQRRRGRLIAIGIAICLIAFLSGAAALWMAWYDLRSKPASGGAVVSADPDSMNVSAHAKEIEPAAKSPDDAMETGAPALPASVTAAQWPTVAEPPKPVAPERDRFSPQWKESRYADWFDEQTIDPAETPAPAAQLPPEEIRAILSPAGRSSGATIRGPVSTPEPREPYRLDGIVWEESDPMAMINRRAVRIGDRIDDAHVMEIHPTRVVLQKDGEKIILR